MLTQVHLGPEAFYNKEIYEALGIEWSYRVCAQTCEFYVINCGELACSRMCEVNLEKIAAKFIEDHNLVKVAYTLRDNEWKCEPRNDLGPNKDEHGFFCSGICQLVGLDAGGKVFNYRPEVR